MGSKELRCLKVPVIPHLTKRQVFKRERERERERESSIHTQEESSNLVDYLATQVNLKILP